MVRSIIRRIVNSVAEGQDCRLEAIFADGRTHVSPGIGSTVVSVVFRNRAAEWRMAFGGMFEFLESYFSGDVEIVGEHGLRRLINLGFRKPFGRTKSRGWSKHWNRICRRPAASRPTCSACGMRWPR